MDAALERILRLARAEGLAVRPVNGLPVLLVCRHGITTAMVRQALAAAEEEEPHPPAADDPPCQVSAAERRELFALFQEP